MIKPARTAATFIITCVIAIFSAATNASAHPDRTILHAGAATSYGYHLDHHHPKHHHHHARAHKAQAKTKPTQVHKPQAKPTLTQNPVPVSAPSPAQPTVTHVPALTEADDQQCTAGNVVAFLQAHDATVLRMVIAPWMAAQAAGLPCIQAAQAAGYKIYLSVRYDAGAPTATTVALFQQVVNTYGPLWAVSVGNEQGIVSDANTASPTPSAYITTWDAVEPLIAAAGAKPVIGESDPWQGAWLEQVMDSHPVGAAAASFHCYTEAQHGGLVAVPALSAAAQADGYPFWCSEMAPVTNNSGTPFFEQQTVGDYGSQVSTTMDESPDVQMESFYEWPQIGAVTPGI